MTFVRVIRKSAKFAVRIKRRFIPFLILYAFIAGSIGIIVNTLDNYQTVDYLDQRGVYIQQATDFGVQLTQAEKLSTDLQSANLGFQLDTISMFEYIVLDSSMRIYSFNLEIPWLHPYFNPGIVVEGSFPNSPDEAMIPIGDNQIRNSSNGVIVESTIATGANFTFENGDKSVSIKISGLFDPTNYVGTEGEDLWFFVPQQTFDQIVELYGYDPATDVFVHSMAIPVRTTPVPYISFFFDVPSTTDYEHIDQLERVLKTDYLGNSTDYGNFDPDPRTTAKDVKINNQAQDTLFLIVAVAFGTVVVTLLGFLLARFRKREIAVLKAMGYTRGNIQISLVTEIFTDAVIGFILGIGGIQIGLLAITDFSSGALLRLNSVLISFIIILIASIPGTLVATLRGFSVSPMTIFRDK